MTNIGFRGYTEDDFTRKYRPFTKIRDMLRKEQVEVRNTYRELPEGERRTKELVFEYLLEHRTEREE